MGRAQEEAKRGGVRLRLQETEGRARHPTAQCLYKQILTLLETVQTRLND